MKSLNWILLLLLLTCSGIASAQGDQAKTRPSREVVDYWVTKCEKQLMDVAEAMPADKYSFAPTEGEFKGVRTFAQQLKHIAAANYILGAALLGEKPPTDAGDEAGPDSVRTKPEIMQYLQGSFTYLHKAAATIDDKNTVIKSTPISPLLGNGTRLGLAVEALLHDEDHYGQMVEYLRMNGIIPPSSR